MARRKSSGRGGRGIVGSFGSFTKMPPMIDSSPAETFTTFESKARIQGALPPDIQQVIRDVREAKAKSTRGAHPQARAKLAAATFPPILKPLK